MATNDIRSNLKQNLGLGVAIASSTLTLGAIIDTADYELGLMFALLAATFSAGTFSMVIEESNDPAMAGATVVPNEKLIGTLPSVSALTGPGDQIATVGLFGTLRYVRASISSTGVTGTSVIVVVSTQKAESMPVV